MATKLKNMHLTSVDLVRAGANQDADICLFKSAEAPESRTDTRNELLDQLAALIEERRTAAKSEPQSTPEIEKEDPHEEIPDDSQTFDEVASERTANETLDLYLDAIEDSIESIQMDDALDETRKNEVMLESLQEFIEAMEELIPELCKTRPEESHFKDLDKSDEGPIEEDIDTIEEVTKFNQNHGADGRFATSGGGGGMAAPAGVKFDAKSAESTLNEAGKSRLNGGPASRWTDKVKSVLESAPAGTVITTTENRGAHSQYTKDEKGWSPDWDEQRRLTDKQLTSSLIGDAWAPASMNSAKISTKENALTRDQIRESHLNATNGQLDQWLRGAHASQQQVDQNIRNHQGRIR